MLSDRHWRDIWPWCQFILPTGVERTPFFSVVISLFLNKVRVALVQVILSTHTHTHIHTLERLLQVINYICKGGDKELCQWPLLPSVCMCVQEWGKINTRHWNWFVASVVNM